MPEPRVVWPVPAAPTPAPTVEELHELADAADGFAPSIAEWLRAEADWRYDHDK